MKAAKQKKPYTGYDKYADGIADLVQVIRQAGLKSSPAKQAINMTLRKLADKGENGKLKYRGHPLWTAAALEIDGDEAIKLSKAKIQALSHEHALPVEWVVNELLTRSFANKGEILKFIKEHTVVVIMTREEERSIQKAVRRKMPVDWDGKDHLARYKGTAFLSTIKHRYKK